MAETKYGHLVKKLNYQKGPFGIMVWLAGKDLEGLDLNIIWGYSSFVGEMTPGRSGGHVHPHGEIFTFVGLDYDHPNELGAEIEEAMGEEGEKHVLGTTSVIAFPPGFTHNPMTIRKADKPYGWLTIIASGELKTTDTPERNLPLPEGNKYAHLIRQLEMRKVQFEMGGNADIISGWNGKEYEGFNLNFTWAFHTGLGAWHEKDPHVHPNDEALLFVGLDPDNPDYLGAEIEIAMGEEQEIHVFDSPTVVVAPRGFVHCPLVTRKVEKPYGFSAICLNNEHDTTWLG